MLFSSSSQRRPVSLRQRWRQIGLIFLTCLMLLVGPQSPLAQGIGSTPAYAASYRPSSPPKPNRYDPKAGTQSKNKGYTPGPMGSEKPHAPQLIPHNMNMSMTAGSVDLKAGQAVSFLGSDGRLELNIPGDAITADDLAQAGGKLSLQITQTAPASGSNAGGSGRISFGSYLVQVVDAKGTLVNHGLRKSVTAKYHFSQKEAALNLAHAYVVFNGARPQGTKLAPTTSRVAAESTFGAPSSQPVQLDTANHTMAVSPMIGTPSSSMTFQSDASIGTFGKPDPFNVDLSAGSLTSDLPIDLPPGPGGLTPPVALSYSSAAVNEQHNPSGAAGWVGEGWNLSLGSINWSEHNVLAGCTTTCSSSTEWENNWQLSDPFGTSSEIIPPNINVSTYYDDTPNDYCGTSSSKAFPCPIL